MNRMRFVLVALLAALCFFRTANAAGEHSSEYRSKRAAPEARTALSISPASLPAGTVGVAYAQTITVSGSTGANQWGEEGNLPPGLQFKTSSKTTLQIAGTPSSHGAYTFMVTVREASGNGVTAQMYTLEINPASTTPTPPTNPTPPPPAPPSITIAPATLPGGTVGVSYSQKLTASTTATGTFTWSITSGSLPTGLSITENGATATIAGTPSTVQTANFTVEVQNSSSSTTQNYSVGITLAQPVSGGGSDLNCPMPTSGNLIANPNMTQTPVDAGVPNCWASGGYGTNTSSWEYPVVGPTSGSESAQVSVSNYVNGAAGWYNQNVPVTPGSLYALSTSYQSSIANYPSYLIAQWTLTDGSLAYDALGNLDSTNGSWTQLPNKIITAPENAASLNILNELESNGTLATTNYSLTTPPATDPNAFPMAGLSFTTDDGYGSALNAQQILDAAGIKGTFYIIPAATAPPVPELFANAGIKPVVSGSTETWGNITDGDGIYIDTTNQQYVLTVSSSTTTATTVTASYMLGSVSSSMTVGTIPAGTHSGFALPFTLPLNGTTTASPISISATAASGASINISSATLAEIEEYMTVANLLGLQADGHDVGTHTLKHCNLVLKTCPDQNASNPPPDTLTPTQEISEGTAALQTDGITNIKSFAYPFGDYEGSLLPLLSGYTSARTVDVGYNDASTNPLELKTYSVVSTTTFSQVKTWIATTVANHWLLVLTLHNIDDASVIEAKGEVDGTTPQILQQITAYAAQLQSEGKLVIDTMANNVVRFFQN